MRARIAGAWLAAATLACGIRADAHARIPATDAEVVQRWRPLPGEEWRVPVVVAAGEAVGIVVEQQGADVAVDLRDGRDQLIAVFQDRVGPTGAERIDVVSPSGGRYVLVIRLAEGTPPAGTCTLRVVSRRTATPADVTAQQARTVRATARTFERRGRFETARALFERTQALLESIDASRNELGIAAFDLGGNALERQDDVHAREWYERAADWLAAADGPDDPHVAMSKSRLGLLWQRAGDAPKAEALIRESLDDLSRALGAAHPWVLQTMVTLGTLRADAGDLDEAEAVDARALDLVRATGQVGTLLDAELLNNLADVKRQRHDLAGAETLFRRSLDIGQEQRGPDSFFVSTALQNLGVVAREREDYTAAAAFYARALAIRERLVGADHPTLAGLLNNLGNVYRATGAVDRSVDAHRRALKLWERSSGPYGRGALLAVGNLERTYAAAGDAGQAIEYERRADAIIERQIQLNLAAGSERQKLAYLRSIAERTDRTLTLDLGEPQHRQAATDLAALVVLQRKGRAQDAMTDVFAAIRDRAAPEDRELLERLRTKTADLARLVLASDGRGIAARDVSYEELEKQKEALEAALSARSADFRVAMRPVTLEGVQAAIPPRGALVEFAVYRRFDPRVEQNVRAYGPARYAAYVLRRTGRTVGIDLGNAAEIDRTIARLRDALRDPGSRDVTDRARALAERIFDPLQRVMPGATHLLVSADGDLDLVPFEALVGPDGHYLVERYEISYLSSGRDLLRMQDRSNARTAATPPLIVADPAFGEPLVEAAWHAARPSLDRGSDRSRTYFAPLPATAGEARAIKALFPDARVVTGRSATKDAVQRARSPRLLHIASHGFFTDDPDTDVAANPLLRAGLAFAGANVTPDHGVLTALEAASLDLRGTRLVTLSACDTGVGQVRPREGVYGLRRAFVLAGAESLVMSLWPVTDALARDTMLAYYQGLRAGGGRGDALRDAKLAIMRRPGRSHPYYWAAFIQSGEWRPLDASH